MAKKTVAFERTKTDSVKTIRVFIDGKYLKFMSNQKAERELSDTKEHKIACTVYGNPGDEVKVVGKVGSDKKVQLTVKVASGESRAFGDKEFKVGEEE